jgi:hypothetical protein
VVTDDRPCHLSSDAFCIVWPVTCRMLCSVMCAVLCDVFCSVLSLLI